MPRSKETWYWPQAGKRWNKTWKPNPEFWRNKTCIDIGIWKGHLNARALKEYNCKTIIGVEPFEEHRVDCERVCPNTKLYNQIEDLPENISVDIIIMHGLIKLLGKYWKEQVSLLLSKVNARFIHVRHGVKNNFTGLDRETNIYDLKNYDDMPSQEELVLFFKSKNYLEKALNKHQGSCFEYKVDAK